MTKSVVAAVLSALIITAGCQGGSGGGELSKEDFISRANAICRSANKTISALPAPDIADAGAAPTTIKRVVAIQRVVVVKLRQLDPPSTDIPAIKEWLKFVDEVLDQAEIAVRALERDDRTSLNDANATGGDAQQQADELARQYGIDRCSKPDDEPTTST